MIETEQRSRRTWAEAELRGAITGLVSAAYGRKEAFPMHIPGQPTDADIVLHDGIDELLAYRAKQRASESTKAVLKRLLRYYDGRVRVSQRLMNQSADVEEAARHAASALQWDMRKQTVLTVARNLEIELETATDPVADEKKGGCVPQDAIAMCSGDGPDKEQVFGTGEVLAQSSAPPASVRLFLDGRKIEPRLEEKTRDFPGYLPAGVKEWLREIDWPYKQILSFAREMLVDGYDIGSDGQRWANWKPGPHVTVTVGDEVSGRARFHTDKYGTWTRVPFPGEAQP